jgi:hypothetical protein
MLIPFRVLFYRCLEAGLFRLFLLLLQFLLGSIFVAVEGQEPDLGFS